MEKKGLFISLEGGEGAGKTTAAGHIRSWLESQGYEVLCSREPGGSRIAEQIRDILLDPKNTEMDPRAEAALYAASRAQHLQEIILPALKEGKAVLCDRYVDSSLVYQGVGRGLGIEEVMALNQFVIDGVLPDITLYFSLDPKLGLERAGRRGELNRLDAEDLSFHEKVREGYDTVAALYPERICTIDASKNEEQVAQQCIAVLKEKLGL